MAKNEIPEQVESEDVKVNSKDLVPAMDGGPINVIKNVASDVKSRAQHRRMHLLDLTKTKHEKWVHGNNSNWKDTPPKFHLGEIQLGMNGGVGQITYNVYMRDPSTGNKIRTPGGGQIATHLVTERFVRGKAMDQEIIENEGVPSIKVALQNWKDHQEEEKSIVKNRRGG